MSGKRKQGSGEFPMHPLEADRPAAQAGVPEGGLGERIRRAADEIENGTHAEEAVRNLYVQAGEADALEARAAEANDLRERCLEVQRILWADDGDGLGCRTAWREALLRTVPAEQRAASLARELRELEEAVVGLARQYHAADSPVHEILRALCEIADRIRAKREGK